MGLCAFCGLRTLYAYRCGRGRGQRRFAKTCGDAECLRLENCARQRTWRERNPRPTRTYPCRACHLEIAVPAGTLGGPRSLCGECRSLGSSVAIVSLRRSVESYLCASCGSTFEREPTRGQRPRWCPSCRGTRKADAARKRANDARRRARTAIDAEQFEPGEIFERDRWRCQIPGCGRLVLRDKPWPHPLSPTIDHIIPLSEGGHHVRANVRCAHARCNVSRGNRGGNDQLLLIG